MSGRVISVKKGKKHLSEVLFENGTSLVLDSDYCAEAQLSVGKKLSEYECCEYKVGSDTRRAKSRALWYLSRADHSEKGLFDKLKKAGFDEAACTAAVDRMKQLAYLDDQKFALRLAKNLLDTNCSPRQAEQKLILKGIPRDIARSAVLQQETDQKLQIRALLERQYRNKMGTEKDVQRTFAALVRRGFDFGDIKSVMREYSENINDCEEF